MFSVPSRRARRGLLLAALAAVMPVPAHAQLGRMIKKAAQGAAAGAAQGAAESRAREATAPARESQSLVPINTQNIDLLLAALAPTVDAATKYESERAAYEAREKKFEAHAACRDTIKKQYAKTPIMPSKATMASQVEYGNKVGEIMPKLAAAQQAGDQEKVRALTDEMGVLGERMENDLLPALKKCGNPVPSAGVSPSSPDLSAPNVPAGMTATQFGRLRERVAAWLLTDGTYKVNDDERNALDARRKDLDRLTPLFKGSALQWSNWSDLTR